MLLTDKIENKIEVLFTFLNKDPETSKEKTLQILTASAMVITLMSSMFLLESVM